MSNRPSPRLLGLLASCLLAVPTACSDGSMSQEMTQVDSPEESTTQNPAPSSPGPTQPTGPETPEGEETPEPIDRTPVDWQPGGESDDCNLDALMPQHAAMRRVKHLLTGRPPTQDEMTTIQENPQALKGMVTRWIETEEHKTKLEEFLQKSLQQTASSSRNPFLSQLNGSDTPADIDAPDALWQAISTSFVRTSMEIIEEGRPFHELASTRTWHMTTAMMGYLLMIEYTDVPEVRFYHEPFTENGITFDATTPLAVQRAQRTFYSTTPLVSCDDPVQAANNRNAGGKRNSQKGLFTLMMTGTSSNQLCDGEVTTTFYEPQDFEDWRPVTLTTLDSTQEPEYYLEVWNLRGAQTLGLHTPRAGFFSHPAFLATWRTNEDNSFRVTTNQMLITGLGLAFEDSDTTTPLGDDGLADDHAAPGTQCYSCHKNLDPMRNFFDVVYQADSYAPRPLEERMDVTPSFSFQSHSMPGDDLADLGNILASHPYFSTGWTQKLCLYANSQKCNEEDPEFQRVVQAFEDSDFDFKTLVIELFSSRLVTGTECAPGDEASFATVSISRLEHLCETLEVRMEQPNPCRINGRARNLADALPDTAWSRGSDIPDLPTEPSLFYAATEKSMCKEIANRFVDRDDSPISSSDMEGSLDHLVQIIMGVPPADPNYTAVRAAMDDHVTQAAEITNSKREQLRSAFVIACTSPFVTSTDF